MRQDNNEFMKITDDQLQFRVLGTGKSVVYEQIIHSYHPTGQMEMEVVQSFDLAYKAYYCDLIKYVFVTFELHESDKQSIPEDCVHSSQAQMLKAKSIYLQELVDEFLDEQRIVAVDKVRDLLARRAEAIKTPSALDVEPDEIPF